MKNIKIIFLVIPFLLFLNSCSSSEEITIDEPPQEKVNLIVDYSFAGIENGFDHQIKLEVLSDDQKIGETTPHLLSEARTASFEVMKGKHKIKLAVLVNFNGSWEEHLKTKDYSIDAVYETEADLNSDQEIKLLFDLDKGAIREYN